jgi:hypothetical protein
MPITQDRMLDLLEETQTLVTRLQLADQAIADISEKHPDLRHELAFIRSLYTETPPLPAFNAEARHFKSNARANLRNRRYMQRRREKEGHVKQKEPFSFKSLKGPGVSNDTAQHIAAHIPTEAEIQATLRDMQAELNAAPASSNLDPSLWSIDDEPSDTSSR